MTRSGRSVALVGVVAAMVAGVLAACTGSVAGGGGSAAPTPSQTGPVSGANMAEHIHNIVLNDDVLLLGTHEGLWSQAPGALPVRVSADAFDVMGFTPAGDRWLASGHPGVGMDAPADLGLMESADQGRSWSEVSLGGRVDFHRLVTSGEVVLGLNSADGRLLRSEDAGRNWTDLGTPGLFDLAIDPADPSLVVGTTQDGPVRSTDGGVNFTAVEAPSLLVLLAWTDKTLYAVDIDGQILASADGGLTWTARGSVGSQPAALTARGRNVAVLADGTVVESTDGGSTFVPRLTNLGGH
jgi:photosystem II stability/assembly factor-like uncharacterized protein